MESSSRSYSCAPSSSRSSPSTRRRRARSSSSSKPAIIDIDKLVAEISRLTTRFTGSVLSEAVGRLLTKRLYGGDLSAWRQRTRKSVSLRKLAAHPLSRMSAAALYRSLAVFEVVSRLGGVSRWPSLTTSHFRAVLGLGAEEQEALLSYAEAQQWSYARLAAEVERGGQRRRNRGGRLPTHPVVRLAHRLERGLSAYDAEASKNTTTMEPKMARRLSARFDAIASRCKEIGRRLRPP